MVTGILLHGYHLEARNWEYVVWGEEPNQLGLIPKTILTILDEGIERVQKLFIGTGASEYDGVKESECILRCMLENLGKLQRFTAIKRHERFQSTRDMVLLERRLKDVAEPETTSQNTREEVACALQRFVAVGG